VSDKTGNTHDGEWRDRAKPPGPSHLGQPFAIDNEVGIWAVSDPDDEVGGQHLIWHWCTELNEWRLGGTGKHTLVNRDPLHMEPSLLWPCCGRHGFIRDGQWVSA
jgi:hypothetical protein